MPSRILTLALTFGVATAGAQTTHDSTAHRALVTRRDVATFGGFVAAGAAMYPLDVRAERAFRAGDVQRSTVAHDAARAFNFAGSPGVLVASAAMLGAGWLAHRPTLERLGLHATEAIVGGSTVTAAVKFLAGRQRPFVEPGDHDDFALGRGTAEGRSSFPSGHATAAFAFASALSSDLRKTHPRAARVLTPMLYGGAALVGAARMYDDKHWASDVVVGAGVGTLAGRIAVKLR